MVSLGVFVGQEIDRFNQLLAVMRKSLVELQKAIKGTVVMSIELEMMFTSFINKKVPLVSNGYFILIALGKGGLPQSEAARVLVQ